MDAVEASLAAQPALLDPAKRGRGIRDHASVDRDHARLEPAGYPQRIRTRPVRGGDEPERGVVRETNRLVLRADRDDRRYRPEYLGPQDGGGGRNVREDRRREEGTGAAGTLAARRGPRTVPQRLRHGERDLVALRDGHE